MQYRQLGNTDLWVSTLAFGASPLGGVFGPIDAREGARAVHAGLDEGINFFDVAPFYGDTRAERLLGKALNGIDRQEYVVATKAGRYGGEPEFDFSRDRLHRSIDESLARLGVDYVDLLHCHDIEFGDLEQIVDEALPALREIVASGRARYIGISGLPLNIFRYVLDRTEVDAVLSYCRFTLFDNALSDIADEVRRSGAGLINAAPLSMGLLTPQGPPAWHPAPEDVKKACRRAVEEADARDTDIAALAIQYALQRAPADTTIIGMASPDVVRENARLVSAPLDETVLAAVTEVLAPIHGRTWPSGRAENSASS